VYRTKRTTTKMKWGLAIRRLGFDDDDDDEGSGFGWKMCMVSI
jgi:hypothetical protein